MTKWMLLTIGIATVPWAFSGNLDPGAPPAPTMKTLDQVQPRTPVQTLAGDATALYVISQPGSYYLTANLTGVSGKDGILINTDNVTVDLNGFALIGVPGSKVGIRSVGGERNTVVRNGSIRGWGLTGIEICTFNGLVDSISSANNGLNGITACVAVVKNCAARENFGDGIRVDGPGSILDSLASDNGGDGLNLVGGSLIDRCISRNNGGAGVKATFENAITNSTLTNNGGGGVRAEVGPVLIAHNQISFNRANAGIWVVNPATNCRIEGNNLVSNAGYGIRIESGAIRNITIGNTASRNTVANYSISAGNTTGSILLFSGGGTITQSTPWSNFEF